MPGSYLFDDDILRLTFLGRTPVPAIGPLLDQALADPECPPKPPLLIDVRRSSSVPGRSAEEMEAAAAYFEARGGRLARVAVLATYGARFEMTGIAAAHAEATGMEIRVFTEEIEATDWLEEAGSNDDG